MKPTNTTQIFDLDLFFDPDLTLPDPANLAQNLGRFWPHYKLHVGLISLNHTEFEKNDTKMELRVIHCNIMKFY